MKTKILYALSVFNAIVLSFLIFSFTSKDDLSTLNFEDKIIKVRGVVVVDSLGVERVIMGANLPEPNNIRGNRKGSRNGQQISGVMLYDSDGEERGGYVTDDEYGNAFLTLDSKTGMNFMALASPNGEGYVRLNDDRGNNKIVFKASEEESTIEITNGTKKKTIKNEN
ncbi:hypothetical protein NAT51_16310 [Flavobacterium amniphilum]|uniref:hypothetical protein n=1 Tax=Flavobacterium amniphilum TaxID=1834035 RepID=UPI00202A62EA|nr:hypothetical protein [Flavobacterium amniphilum]MCL9807100.1 hypothetical protein [Flavobacterium amniphilum]